MLTTHNTMHPQAEVDRLWLSEVQACVPPPPPTPTAPAHLPFVFWKSCKWLAVGPDPHTKIPWWGLKIGYKCPTLGQQIAFFRK